MSGRFASQPGQGWLATHSAQNPARLRIVEPYSDRACPPAETVARLAPHLHHIGITRLADVTGLDRIGIPVWMAIRPNAATLSVSQGKGIDADAAKASALMESTELAVAERPLAAAFLTTRVAIEAGGGLIADSARFLRIGAADYPADAPRRFVEAADLIAERAVHVPEEIVGFSGDPDSAARYVQTSDGLASGNILLEAVFHGLCERIERDAMALWSFKSDAAILSRRIDPARFEDPVLTGLCRLIAEAGLRLRLYDATSDIGVPTVFALIAPEGRAADLRHLEIASGSGTHPDPVRAALRAVTEAAQTRLTTIAGARDDFHPATYAETLARDLAIYLDSGDDMPAKLPPREEGVRDLDGRLGATLEKCAARGIRSVLVVPIGGEEYGVAVAKVIVADLEDKPGAANRKPGRRALRAMMGMR